MVVQEKEAIHRAAQELVQQQEDAKDRQSLALLSQVQQLEVSLLQKEEVRPLHTHYETPDAHARIG